MIDRDKVIKGLKQCAIDGEESCKECPYFGVTCCLDVLQEEASIILLKEQEAVEPEVEVLNEIDRLYRCPKCHKHFFYKKQKYCHQCGQAVKWE